MTEATPSHAAVRLGLRAPRVVVVIDGTDHWQYWARLALHGATQIWGGYGFILIPHQNGIVSKALLNIARAYDPDYVTLLHRTIRDWETVAPGSIPITVGGKTPEGERRAEIVRQTGNSPVRDEAGERARLVVRDVCSSYRRRLPPAEEWFEDCSRLYIDRQSRPLTSISSIPGVDSGTFLTVPPEWGERLGVALAAKCGAFERPLEGAESLIEGRTRRQAVRWLYSTRAPYPAPKELVWHPGLATSVDPLKLATAFDRTRHGLVQVSGGLERSQTGLVIGDTADDFALALAWDRMFGMGMWVPQQWWTQDQAVGTSLKHALASVLHDAAYFQQKLCVMSVSDTASAQQLANELGDLPETTWSYGAEGEQVRRHAEIVIVDEFQFSDTGALSLAVAEQFDQQFALPVTQDRDGGRTLVGPPPAPETLHAALRGVDSLNWQVDLEFWPPSMPRGRGFDGMCLLAPGEDEYLTWVRSGRSGISYESHRYNLVLAGTPAISRLARPRLRELGLSEWASRLVSQVGLAIELSPAGRRAEILRRMWGSREGVTRTLSGELLPVLKTFNPTDKMSEKAYPEEEGVVLLTGAREGYLTFQGMIKNAPAGLDISDLRNAVDRLLTIRALRRGLVLDCDECGRPAYYELADVSQLNLCPRCGASNQLVQVRWRKPLEEPRWYYDLHPALRELLSEHGEVPFVLGEYLRSQYRTYVDTPEFELYERDGSGKIAEADLLALCDGQLVVAEAKSTSSLGSSAKELRRAAAKRVRLAETLQADQIVLATTQRAWSEASIQALQSAVNDQRWPAGAKPTIRLITGLTTPDVRDSSPSPRAAAQLSRSPAPSERDGEEHPDRGSGDSASLEPDPRENPDGDGDQKDKPGEAVGNDEKEGNHLATGVDNAEGENGANGDVMENGEAANDVPSGDE